MDPITTAILVSWVGGVVNVVVGVRLLGEAPSSVVKAYDSKKPKERK